MALEISIVVPCFNEEETIPIFYEEALKVLKSMNINFFEFIFVDDGSSDKTLDTLHDLSGKDTSVRFLSFSRNFGKEAALYAGLSKASGKFMARLSNVAVVDGARDFRLMTKQYKDAVLSLCEKNRFTKGIFPWIGFKTKWFAYENVERVAGKTKWSFWKLFLYSIDGIIGFSTKPLAFSAVAGILGILLSFVFIIFIIIRRLIFGDPVQGWASLVCIILFISGVQLFTTGIAGLYIAKIYTEVKQRPLFIIKEEK